MTPSQEKRIASLREFYKDSLVILGINGMGGVVVEVRARAGKYHVLEIGKRGHRELLQVNSYSRVDEIAQD